MSPVRELEQIEKEALEALQSAASSERVRELEITYLGRKGPLARVGKSLGTLPVEERRTVGQAANRVRGSIESAISGKLADLDRSERSRRLEAERVDVTQPGRVIPHHLRHAVRRIRIVKRVLSVPEQ
ncbi:MAG TPA: hypothetical protein VHJ78_01505 [Actinomycetota bacterium]|nr:hypothetical protein [Actinomycetota bacterium]